MSLHNDFPFMSKPLYCKKCKESTTHIEDFNDFKCNECGSKWDSLLIQLNMIQNQYGKPMYQGIILSEKPVNTRNYVTKTFDELDKCIDWLTVETGKLEDSLR